MERQRQLMAVMLVAVFATVIGVATALPTHTAMKCQGTYPCPTDGQCHEPDDYAVMDHIWAGGSVKVCEATGNCSDTCQEVESFGCWYAWYDTSNGTCGTKMGDKIWRPPYAGAL